MNVLISTRPTTVFDFSERSFSGIKNISTIQTRSGTALITHLSSTRTSYKILATLYTIFLYLKYWQSSRIQQIGMFMQKIIIGNSMTFSTKCFQIGEFICNSIVIKQVKGDNMVDYESLNSITISASIGISHKCFLSLYFPVLSSVISMSTLP